MLKIKNLTIKGGDKLIVSDFDFQFEKGKRYVIMGPNGSGKTSLALGIMGHPNYRILKGNISLDEKKINNLSPDERSKEGLFLSFQAPLELEGVKIHQLLQSATEGKYNLFTLRKKISLFAKELHLKEAILNRSLNEDASGGERKKLELIQAAILNREYSFFDEIDTGVDVDSLKIIAKFLEKYQNKKTQILITHYYRIIEYLPVDKVLVIYKGKLIKVGGKKLSKKIDEKGYQWLVND